MVNYDLDQREKIEELMIGIIIHANDPDLKLKKEFLFIHKIDDENYFRKTSHRCFYFLIKELWSQEVDPTPELMIATIHRNKESIEFSNEELLFEFMYVEQRMHYFASYIHFRSHYIHEFKRYIYIDFWNNKANSIKSTDWDSRDVGLFSDNTITEYNLLQEKLFESHKGEVNTQSLSEEMKQRRINRELGISTGVKLGIESVDKFAGGSYFFNGEFTVIGARPGMGKTTFILTSSVFNTKNNKELKTIIFTLEMSQKELLLKIISPEVKIDYKDLRNGNYPEEMDITINQRIEYYLENTNLKIISSTNNLSEIISIIEDEDPDIVFIDYLQLVKTKIKAGGNREQEVSEISRSLKAVARKREIPVVALAQLSRAVENNKGRRPLLSNLRESGSLEQDADNVIFLYRDAYYAQIDNSSIDLPEIEQGNMEVIIAKGRSTGLKTFNIHMSLTKYLFNDGFKMNTYNNMNLPDLSNPQVPLPPPE